MNNYNDLTIFFVSYFSRKNIEKILYKINKKIKVLIIDNARENGLKDFFERKFKNTKVITSRTNSGQSGGINLGFKNIKSKYAIYMDSDVKFNSRIINTFLKTASEIKDFIILAPQHERSIYKKDFLHPKKSINKNQLQKMKLVHGHFLFFNMINVKKVGMFDENFFLYYEETDYCLRAFRKNENIYVLPGVKVKHLSGKSVDLKNSIEIEANKHWHFMWSKFFYFKKNYSLLTAISKTLPFFVESFLKFIFFYFINNRKKIIYFNQFNGLINSYLGKKSFRRLKLSK